MTEVGRSGASAPSGSQAAPGAAEVASPPSVSIPIALPIGAKLSVSIGRDGICVIEISAALTLESHADYIIAWLNQMRGLLAQGIEARRAETRSGSVADESPVGEADAPKGDEG